MKKLFLLGLALILFIACQKEQTQRYFSESSEIDSFKSSVIEYANGDWDTWSSHFADTAKFYVNSNKAISLVEFKKGQQELLSNFSSYGFIEKGSFIEMVLDSDDETWINYWATWQGKLKANDQEISIPVHITQQYIDGKGVTLHNYWDSAPITAALGKIEAFNNLPDDEKAVMTAVNKVVEGWNAHDISNLKSLSVEKLKRTSNGILELNNIGDYEGFMKTFVTAFPDFKVSADKVDLKGNKVYINWTVTGTHNGDFMGNAATGKKIKTHGISVWTMNGNGKFVSEDAYYDNQVLFGQLGISAPAAN